MRGIPEIVESEWVLLTHGITVLTGRSNVGKTSEATALMTLLQPVIQRAAHREDRNKVKRTSARKS